MVVLPEPDGPITAILSPGPNMPDTSSRIRLVELLEASFGMHGGFEALTFTSIDTFSNT
eukprot:CAMPEP_0119315424 /NCGR_PEP_ID=MMETSP1333-20130426/35800_1 /TAXON_ID=418940 /ORGANISM="Scyphosphaera apsteinii, Strain RCC1455" /LENGTH=58 /DNA_ID=CAMNT_0007320779 /DNA_START=203 /DNA_END=376 /DNA_ORIENTATION=+